MSDIERLRQLTENCRNEKNQHMIGNIEIIYHETWFPDMQKRAEKGFPFINEKFTLLKYFSLILKVSSVELSSTTIISKFK